LLSGIDDEHHAIGGRKAGVHGRVRDDAAHEVLDLGHEGLGVASTDTAAGHRGHVGEGRVRGTGEHPSGTGSERISVVGVDVELARGDRVESGVSAGSVDLQSKSVAKPLSDKYIGLGPLPQELHNIANIAADDFALGPPSGAQHRSHASARR